MSLPPAAVAAAFVAPPFDFASCASAAGAAIRIAVAARAANSRWSMCMSDSPCRWSGEFFGCQRADRERVDMVRQKIADACEDGLMALEPGLAAKRLRHDEQ